MILGWVYGKKVLPIVYSKKMTNVIEDIEFKGIYTDIHNISDLEPETVFSSMKENSIDVSRQIKDAKRHFDKLDSYLES